MTNQPKHESQSLLIDGDCKAEDQMIQELSEEELDTVTGGHGHPIIGAILGGVVGTTAIPIPVVGTVVGAVAGAYIGKKL